VKAEWELAVDKQNYTVQYCVVPGEGIYDSRSEPDEEVW